MAEEDRIQERIDEAGNRWQKIYLGGGEHCKHWIGQFKEPGQLQVEEIGS